MKHRFLRWLGELFCAHRMMIVREPNRIYECCMHCGKESTGWTLNARSEGEMTDWDVHIVHRHDLLETQIFIFRRDGDDVYVLHEKDTEKIASGTNPRPLLTLHMHSAQEILQGFSQQLQQLGFGAPSTDQTFKAQAKHIESLEKQTNRLFDLAKIGAQR